MTYYTLIRVLFIIFTTVFMYRKTLSYGYLIDDLEVSTHPKTGIWWKDLWGQIRGHAYFNPTREHGITLSFHVLNSVLIYFVFGQTDVAFLAAVLFSLHPSNTQASVWLSGKVYSIATTCILLGLVFKPLIFLFYPIAVYWSLNAVLLPLLLPLMGPWYYSFAILGLLLHKKRIIKEPKRRYTTIPPLMREASPRKLIISLRTMGYYLCLSLFPRKVTMCHSYLHVFGLSKKETIQWYRPDRYFFIALLVLAFAVTGLVLGWKVTGLVWFCLLMMQWCNFIVLSHPITERYLYLANVGMMYFIAQTLLSVPMGEYLAVGLVVYYATKLHEILPNYETNMKYFKGNMEQYNNVAIAYNQYGLELVQRGKAGTAMDVFLKGLQFRQHDFRLNYNTANVLLGMRRFNEALPFIYRAEENLDPKNNYEVWKQNIENMKNQIRTSGVNCL